MTSIVQMLGVIALLLALWGGWVIRRQSRELARKKDELKRQKFVNNRSKIVAEIAARIGRSSNPIDTLPEIKSPLISEASNTAPENQEITNQETNPQQQNSAVPDENKLETPVPEINVPETIVPAAAAPLDQPAMQPAIATISITPQLQTPSLTEALAVMPEDPSELPIETVPSLSPPPANNPPPPISQLSVAQKQGAAPLPQLNGQNRAQNRDSKNQELSTPSDTLFNGVLSKAKASIARAGIKPQSEKPTEPKIPFGNKVPIEKPSEQQKTFENQPNKLVTAMQNVDKQLANDQLALKPIPPQRHSDQNLAIQPLATPDRTPPPPDQQMPAQAMLAQQIAPNMNGAPKPGSHVNWQSVVPDAAIHPSARTGAQQPLRQSPELANRQPVVQPRQTITHTPKPKPQLSGYKIDPEDSLYEQINSYAKWIALQSSSFVLERHEEGEPIDLIPVLFDKDSLERRNGHWFELFKPMELDPLVKQLKSGAAAIYCPFTDSAVETLRIPAVEILSLADEEDSPRHQRVIKESALRDFVEFLEELKSMAVSSQ